MSEQASEKESKTLVNESAPAVEAQDPVRKITKYILVFSALVFIWYIVADRHAPWSDQARVQTYV
ncbi:MAG TPA: HlyD family secretion protein, partial [Colwellia sp.]|nr:HlyD family secretion protein [Colwellia sp.]